MSTPRLAGIPSKMSGQGAPRKRSARAGSRVAFNSEISTFVINQSSDTRARESRFVSESQPVQIEDTTGQSGGDSSYGSNRSLSIPEVLLPPQYSATEVPSHGATRTHSFAMPSSEFEDPRGSIHAELRREYGNTDLINGSSALIFSPEARTELFSRMENPGPYFQSKRSSRHRQSLPIRQLRSASSDWALSNRSKNSGSDTCIHEMGLIGGLSRETRSAIDIRPNPSSSLHHILDYLSEEFDVFRLTVAGISTALSDFCLESPENTETTVSDNETKPNEELLK